MDDKTRKELEEAHKKAMEGLKALTKEIKETTNEMYNYFGVPKDAFKHKGK